MVVCDSLSRARPMHSVDSEESSPNENDPYFPNVPEPVIKIHLPNGSSLQEIICIEQPPAQHSVKHLLIQPSSFQTLQDCDSAYDGDTDLPQVKPSKIKRKSAVRGKIQTNFPRLQERYLVDLQQRRDYLAIYQMVTMCVTLAILALSIAKNVFTLKFRWKMCYWGQRYRVSNITQQI